MCVHSYSEAGLTKLSDLKNKDRAVADLLKALTERPDSGIDVHFALLSKEEAGTAHGNKYCGYEMTDVGNEESCIKNFMSLDGSKPFGIGELPLDDDVCMLVSTLQQSYDFNTLDPTIHIPSALEECRVTHIRKWF